MPNLVARVVVVSTLVAGGPLFAQKPAASPTSGDSTTIRIGLFSSVTGLVDALADFVRSKVKKPDQTAEALRNEAKGKVAGIVQLGDTFSLLRRYMDRAYQGRPHLETMRQILYAGREAGQKPDWAAIKNEWAVLSPFLVDLKATTEQEIDRIPNPELERWVRSLRDAHLVYFAQIDTAVRAEQEARLLDLLGKLGVIFDSAVPAVNAFFTDLRRDTEQLREWSTAVGQAKGGPSKVKDPDGDRILKLLEQGYQPPPIS